MSLQPDAGILWINRSSSLSLLMLLIKALHLDHRQLLRTAIERLWQGVLTSQPTKCQYITKRVKQNSLRANKCLEQTTAMRAACALKATRVHDWQKNAEKQTGAKPKTNNKYQYINKKLWQWATLCSTHRFPGCRSCRMAMWYQLRSH